MDSNKSVTSSSEVAHIDHSHTGLKLFQCFAGNAVAMIEVGTACPSMVVRYNSKSELKSHHLSVLLVRASFELASIW